MNLSQEHQPATDQSLSTEQPRIKIKFRAILQAGDDKKPPKFMWHVPSANEEAATVSGVDKVKY